MRRRLYSVICLVFAVCVLSLILYAQTSNYPTTLDTNTTLFITADNVQTTLGLAMGTGDTTAVVTNIAGFAVNQIATICDTTTQVATGVTKCSAWEHMLITGVSGSSGAGSLTITRGVAGTSARTHVNGSVISVLIDAAHQQALSSAVRNVETWTRPVANIKGFGAVCNGTDQNTAIQAAISAGAKNILIPAGCTWIAPGGIITGGVTYWGEGSTSIIQSSATPASTTLYAGPNVALYNLNAKGNGCVLVASSNCLIGWYFNADPANNRNIVIQGNGYSLRFENAASGSDSSTASFITNSTGDGIFTDAVLGSSGVGIRAWNEDTTGYGIVVDRRQTGTGLAIFDDISAAATGTMLYLNTPVKTSGDMINFAQTASTFTGSGITMNMGASGGTFTGQFLNLQNGGAVKYQVNSQGVTQVAGNTLASLPTPGAGNFLFARCSNCNVNTSPCTSGGSGSWAFYNGTAWNCPNF